MNALREEWPRIIIYDDDRDRKLRLEGIHLSCHGHNYSTAPLVTAV